MFDDTDPNAADSAEPIEFGRYRLLRCLGHGGMGSVHLAFDERLQRQVAIKQILSQRLAQPEVRARFQREVLALSRLDHPNLCHIHDAGEVEGVPYISMQYVAGRNLAEAIRSADEGEAQVVDIGATAPAPGAPRLPDQPVIRELLMIFEKLARALHYAHERGLVHRDIKPANIVITAANEPVLLDFGLALDDSGPTLTKSDQNLGTPMYMAPEQITGGRTQVTGRTDVYALAVTLYHALTLRPPFIGLTEHQLYAQIVREEAPRPRQFNPCLDRQLEIVLATALAKSPADRYRDAAAFAEDLRRARLREPILARRPAIHERAWRWVQRNRVVAAFLIAISASLVLTIGALLSAGTARAGMRASIRSFNRLATIEDLRRAEAAADELYPAWPPMIGRLEGWLRDFADPLRQQLGAFSADVAALEQLPPTNAALRSGDREEIDAATQQYLLRTMQEQLPLLRKFATDPDGTIAHVQRRLRWAREVEVASLRHPRWQETIAAVRADPRFAGMALEPQADLVPIGADADSGLQEFLHLPSHGEGLPIPTRDAASRSLDLVEHTGIVLVLLPGGSFRMGAQDEPRPEDDEVPHEVTLAAFFLAKHELTQAQWRRLVGTNPSQFQPGTQELTEVDGEGRKVTAAAFTLRHPVEQVTWEESREFVRRYGLQLPTEAQWEYACRAGTTTPWHCEPENLRFHANLADATGRLFSRGTWPGYEHWDDGCAATAPVGRYRPNRFGLHDLHGNVWEWCQDWLLPYDSRKARPGDGLRLPDAADDLRNKVYRGGAYLYTSQEARSANRMRGPRQERGNTLGLRPARAILQTSELPEQATSTGARR